MQATYNNRILLNKMLSSLKSVITIEKERQKKAEGTAILWINKEMNISIKNFCHHLFL